MARVIARVSGVALRPGVSRNGRLYTRDAIGRMVARAQDKLSGGGTLPVKGPAPVPISQLTHHAAAAADDSLRIVGAVRRMSLDEDGAARFDADIADTPHGRTIASLLDTSDGQPPFLRNVSIRGAWVGDTQTLPGKDGDLVTGADLELFGLDYTGSPGVPGAQVDRFEWASGPPHPDESGDGRDLIYESVPEAHVTPITEEAAMTDEQFRVFLAGVRETLTAGQVLGTQPPPATAPAAGPAPVGPPKPLHQMNSDELADFGSAWWTSRSEADGLKSPFWR